MLLLIGCPSPGLLFRGVIVWPAGGCCRELVVSEQIVPSLSRRRLPVLLETFLQDGETALHGGASTYCLVPTLYRGIVFELLSLEGVRAQPGVGGNVSNRILAGEIVRLGKTVLH